MNAMEQVTRECPPWCTDDGHTGQLQDEDQVPTGDERLVPVSLTQCVPPSTGWNIDGTDVAAELWRAYGEETAVIVFMGDDVQIKLTPSEARQLAQHITALCDEATA